MHTLLSSFIGKWKTDGRIIGTDTTVNGTDTYEWLPGGFAVLHRVDAMVGEERNQSVEMMGYDAAAKNFQLHSFDPAGNAVSMQAMVNKGEWIFTGTTLRFTGRFSADGHILSGVWEQLNEQKEWKQWMEIRLQRTD